MPGPDHRLITYSFFSILGPDHRRAQAGRGVGSGGGGRATDQVRDSRDQPRSAEISRGQPRSAEISRSSAATRYLRRAGVGSAVDIDLESTLARLGRERRLCTDPIHSLLLRRVRGCVARVRRRYFVSGGFASIGEDSKLAVSTLMAAPLEELDADAIKTGLAQYQAAYEKARRAPGLSRAPSRNLRGAASELSRNLRSRLGTSRDPPEPLPSPSETRPRPARDLSPGDRRHGQVRGGDRRRGLPGDVVRHLRGVSSGAARRV